ncbi:MAG: TIR domain-containing protein [Phycisphaerae bacterium]|jgi:anti-sigma regulatory factor (Ser/Thr protein kinase)|nr:TIR domain-containing protein [Phycisphaerae bacterium]
MTQYVFISYSQEDRDTAEAVCRGIEQKGVSCWIAPRNILPGKSWAGSIVEAIDGTDVMVLILSGNSNGSPHVIRELERAANNRVSIIPFKIEKVDASSDIAYFISTSQWLDATSPPLEAHIEELAGIILQITANGSDTPVVASQDEPTRLAIDYSPALLDSWEKSLLEGHWTQTVDCRDEIFIQDLRLLLREVLTAHGVAESSVVNVEVALTELCRNVAEHAAEPVAQIDIAVNYKFKRFRLAVASDGPAFTREAALAKYADAPEAESRIHGLSNLVSRGELRIVRAADVNRVQFSCVLSEKKTGGEAYVAFECHQSEVRIGSHRHRYREWLELMGREVKLSGTTPPEKTEALKVMLIRESDGSEPVEVRIVRQEPDWTVTLMEIVAMHVFSEAVSSLAGDDRFKVKSAESPKGGARAARARSEPQDSLLDDPGEEIIDIGRALVGALAGALLMGFGGWFLMSRLQTPGISSGWGFAGFIVGCIVTGIVAGAWLGVLRERACGGRDD